MNNLKEYLGGYDPKKKDRPEEEDVPEDDPDENGDKKENRASLGGGLVWIIIACFVVVGAIASFVIFHVLRRRNVVIEEPSDIADVALEDGSWID